ncbi:MAG TPA: ATP-binding protein [Dinghuibacter sp.]|uniref:sensor histidine kinase n=1 Tax=Dinghuibacter sp. TaxID=2024697 RepID=UPI002CA203A1|nr:ATP-binding protein [Dinghuibacter sp.]HTJ12994.1 ATP-binding protein [Dinghuibacter sp.]
MALRCWCILGLIWALSLEPSGLRAQEGLPLHFVKCAQDQGLSSYNVKKIIQDTYGFMWVATQDGLDRFDGRRFVVYNSTADARHRIVNNDIWDMVEDTAREILWVESYSGINAIDLRTGEVTHSTPALVGRFAFPSDWLKRLRFAGGHLWIGTYDGVTMYDTVSGVCTLPEPIPFPRHKEDSAYNVNTMYADEFGHLWVFLANYGLTIYDGASGHVLQSYTFRQLGLPDNTEPAFFRTMAFVSSGDALLATNRGLYDVHYGRTWVDLKPRVLPGLPAGARVAAAAIDPDGRVWLAAQHGLYCWDRQLIPVDDLDPSGENNWLTNIYSISFDREGDIWLSAEKGVAWARNRRTPFVPYVRSPMARTCLDHVFYVFPETDTSLLACATDGLSRVHTVSGAVEPLVEGDVFYFAGRLPDGRCLIADQQRTFIFESGRLQPIGQVYPELAELDGRSVNSLVTSGDSLVVMGTESFHGVFCWNPRTHALDHIHEGRGPNAFASGIVNTIYKDSRGRMWVLADDSFGILDLRTKRVENYHMTDGITRQPYNFYFDAAEAGGLTWLAIYGHGLYGVDSAMRIHKFIGIPQGLTSPGVYRIVPSGDTALLVTTNNGLCRVDLRTWWVSSYFRKDGLASNSFEENCGYYDGRYLYSGGEGGLTRIEPSQLEVNDRPPVLYPTAAQLTTGLSNRDTANLLLDYIEIRPDVVQTNLSFSVLDFANPQRTQLAYAIDGVSNGWVNLGAQQFINLVGLRPGAYTLHVRAANEDGVLTPHPLTLQLVYLPRWYQTQWFLYACILLGILFFVAIYRYRVVQLQQQSRIRREIASDLHDDFGSTLNGLKYYVHLSRRDPRHLDNVDTSVGEAIKGLRDMIWVLDDKFDTLGGLVEHIRKNALPLLSATGITLDCAVAPGAADIHLSKSEKRNLLMIARESITNILKYADCTHIRIEAAGAPHRILFRIRDNGRGFNPTASTEGHGLKNIRTRAAQMRYQVSITSRPGDGTEIKVWGK